MHHLIKSAYKTLYPGKEPDFEAKLKYSAAFKGYNAKVLYTSKNMEFRLSKNWKEVSDEIQEGLIQSLMNKRFGTDIRTINTDLYEIFLKKIPAISPKTSSDPVLDESFRRVNERYMNEMMLQPNLEWASDNFRTLGTYEYNTDTIRISSLLKKDHSLLDYVMYHEMLHKKLGYKKTGKKTMHHSKEFRELEKRFHDKDIEKKLKEFLKKEKRKGFFDFF